MEKSLVAVSLFLLATLVLGVAGTGFVSSKLTHKSIALPSRQVTLSYVQYKTSRTSFPKKAPLLFIHGLADSWTTYVRAFEAYPLHLANRDIYAVSLRGHGDSSKPRSFNYTVDDFTKDLIGFLDAIRVYRVVVIGHSIGSIVAQSIAIKHLSRVEAVVLISTTSKIEATPEGGALLGPAFSFGFPGGTTLSRQFVVNWETSLTNVPIPNKYVTLWINEALKLPDYVWRDTLYGAVTTDNGPFLKNIQVPVLIITGKHDFIFYPSTQAKVTAALPNAKSNVYVNDGHCPHREEPTRFIADLHGLLSQVA
mmetsp:Transcript_43501/g.70578  ORF Transcript_43501/g.70578 Transcript_43501/m.70578 type:complete len:309 (-) Transcript_43501:207-1133(-)|eukprot:CAMPEP_0184644274 /NCGR_PEP_ID=MMETSP0308-20130426/1025_1 /TAXON_ID=38269 /ORGANISM="Gloeochaete witrockiana, Strain SAG 46.84" /LENGTH=308 /DNA_ID=CAMNT_0027072721 /DNA_START=127 /DNA_END=1053 /DNA_ORIENTATION=+